MADSRPIWRRIFDTTERLVGVPLESLANTPEFADVIATTARLRRTLEKNRDAMSAWLLHQSGLPARGDVDDVARAVARVERRLQKLSHELEEIEDARRRAAEARPGEESQRAKPEEPRRAREKKAPPARGKQSS